MESDNKCTLYESDGKTEIIFEEENGEFDNRFNFTNYLTKNFPEKQFEIDLKDAQYADEYFFQKVSKNSENLSDTVKFKEKHFDEEEKIKHEIITENFYEEYSDQNSEKCIEKYSSFGSGEDIKESTITTEKVLQAEKIFKRKNNSTLKDHPFVVDTVKK